MQKMIARKAFTYRAVQLCVGQEFDVDEDHVELFSLIGFARLPEGSRGRQEYDTRVLTAGHNLASRRRAMRKAAVS